MQMCATECADTNYGNHWIWPPKSCAGVNINDSHATVNLDSTHTVRTQLEDIVTTLSVPP